MSKIVNDGKFKPGSIYRIALKNFVTYKEVELFPERNLNVIIGPNGTGKSTFVCAIVLGLCGKTNVIGRAKKLGEFVKSGCQHATIELELYRYENERNVIITRNFNLENNSTWMINEKSVKEKQVQELIATLNIQVDNLCQLLPQDRVQDFAKLNTRELLKSTLLAVSGTEMITQLEDLVENRIAQRSLGSKLASNTKQLEEQVRLNDRLKSAMEAIEHRKKIEAEIEMCNRKKLWLEYGALREKLDDLGNDKNEGLKVLKTHKERMAPTEKEIAATNTKISKLETSKISAGREIHVLNNKLRATLESSDMCTTRISDIHSDLREKIEQARSRKNDIHNAKLKLDKTVSDTETLLRDNGDESHLKQKIAEMQDPIRKTNSCIDDIKRKKLQMQLDLDSSVRPQLRLYNNRLKSLEDVMNKKMDILKTSHNDAYQAVLWFRSNKHLFQSDAYEPMILELNFTEPRFAKYLENTVNRRDLVAFTFTSSQDMNLFIKKTRNELKLKTVNAVCSPVSRSHFDPPVSLEQIRHLGFYTWLKNVVTGPDAVIRYLCSMYGIHRIPIGDAESFQNSEKMPMNIPLFYTENHCFFTKISAYSGTKSTQTTEIREPRILANTMDNDMLQSVNEQLVHFQNCEAKSLEQMKTFDKQSGKLEESLNGLMSQRKKLSDTLDQLRSLMSQARMQQRTLNSLQSEPTFDVQSEKSKCVEMIKNSIVKQSKLQKDLSSVVKALQTKSINEDLWKVKLQLMRKSLVEQEAHMRELKRNASGVEDTLANIERLLSDTKVNAKAKLKEAKQCCDNKLPQDPDFPYNTQFQELPTDLNALNFHCAKLQTKVELMDNDDQPIAREYEERQKSIEKLTAEVKNFTRNKDQLEANITRLRDSWVPAILELISDINQKFGEMFTRLGCSGEVKLDKAAGDEDYDQYGIGIYVCFRSGETISKLNPHTQSGGERALTTALYLMALQQLSTVPFRCVDEINQGMDPINERKMFQLLVDVTTNCDSAQYFLLTPKLLDSFKYIPEITVHTVMNGPHITNYRNWTFDKFLEAAKN